MKTARVTVRFPHGLHARPAVRVVQLFKKFRSRVLFRAGARVASATSLISILLLAATFNTQLEVQAAGEDEDAAVRAAEVFFQNEDELVAGDDLNLDSATDSVVPEGGGSKETQSGVG